MKYRLWFVSLAAVLVIGCALMVESFQGALAADGESVVVTYSQGALHATIPYLAPHGGSGRLIIDVLNPEDEVLGHSERAVEVGEGKGSWKEDIKLSKAVAIDDLVWHRL